MFSRKMIVENDNAQQQTHRVSNFDDLIFLKITHSHHLVYLFKDFIGTDIIVVCHDGIGTSDKRKNGNKCYHQPLPYPALLFLTDIIHNKVAFPNAYKL